MHKLKYWLAAARLRTLPLSVSGIIVGSSLSGYTNRQFNQILEIQSKDYYIFFGALFTTIVFQILSNFANDYGDGVKGTDALRKGEARMVSSGKISSKQMKNATIIFALIGLMLSINLVFYAFKGYNLGYVFLFLGLGIASIVSAIKYTVGNNAYGYSGFGDVFVFIFFGLLSVCGSYFLYTKTLNLYIVLPAISIGMLSVAVLNLNNMRDIENDKINNKITLVVKKGYAWAKQYHLILVLLPLILSCFYVYFNYKSLTQFVFFVAFIPLFFHLKKIRFNKNPELLDGELKKVALSTFLYAVLFSIFN